MTDIYTDPNALESTFSVGNDPSASELAELLQSLERLTPQMPDSLLQQLLSAA